MGFSGLGSADLNRSSVDPCQVLSKRSLHEELAVCLRCACMKALVGSYMEALVSRSCQIRSSNSSSLNDDLVRFSSGSWHEDLASRSVTISLCLVRRYSVNRSAVLPGA